MLKLLPSWLAKIVTGFTKGYAILNMFLKTFNSFISRMHIEMLVYIQWIYSSLGSQLKCPSFYIVFITS